MKSNSKIIQSVVIIVLFFLLFSNVVVHAQKVSIDWDSNPFIKEDLSRDSIIPHWVKYLYFDGAAYPDIRTMLPHYEGILNHEIDPEAISISNVRYDTVMVGKPSDVMGFTKLDSTINLQTESIYLQKKPYLRYSFVPVIKSGNQLLLLTEFTLQTKSKKQKLIVKSRKAPASVHEASSVLSSGNWFKIRVKQTGIYKISYDQLTELGISNPSNVRIYGNVGGQLPYNINASKDQGLKENPLYMHTDGDDSFDKGDYILFYGQGPNRWRYNSNNEMFIHHLHNYSEYSYYYLTSGLGKGKRIDELEEVQGGAEVTFTDYVYLDYHEEDEKNLIGSGRQWYELMENNESDIIFTVHDIVTTKEAKVKARMVGRSKGSSSFSVYHASAKLDDIGIASVNFNSSERDFARAATTLKGFAPTGGDIPIQIRYNRATSDDKGWLDYVMINAYRQLKMADRPMFFRQFPSDINLAKFELQNATEGSMVWDVTNPHDVKQVPASYSNGKLSFISHMEGVSEFVAFHLSQSFLEPEFLDEVVPNQDLLGMEPVNYIIVTHPEFLEQANELADIHRNASQLSVAVVTLQQIYNDFSSGAPDVSAIRDFFKWIYDKDNPENPVFKYALLFGDGSYDNKNPEPGSNFIPTYQSDESLYQVGSFVADDYFTFLDPGEGDNGGTMDIGIGRFPVRTQKQADEILTKISLYLDVKTLGPWRNRLCFIGDDEDGNLHMDQADRLTRKVKTKHPEFLIDKVYLDAYKQQVSANGTSYPEVEKTIYDALENGVLLFNYTGHGSENGLAHERIILKSDIQNWRNSPYFPLFITATCEFSRFDEDEKTTAGEYVLLNPDGGGIALLTTTRLVYAGENFTLNNKFFDYAFQLENGSSKYRFGDVLRLSKNATSGSNKRNFTLLGDPALALNYPLYRIYTDSINNIPVSENADTVSAFSKVTISGYVGDYNQNIMENFNGTVYPVILDKEQEITTLNNDGNGGYTFVTRNNSIYKGRASVENGRFRFSFIVPKDISYNIGQGKIVYYAENRDIDAHGYNKDIYIGGAPEELIIDNEGPELNLYLNDSNFVNGGITDANPKLYATVYDESGINATGAGIGHDIIAYLNGNTKDVLVLNQYYETLQDNFSYGTITYPLQNLEPGRHTLTLKIWDIVNNSSETTIEFEVLEGSNAVIKNVSNHPNPFSNITYFNAEHNIADRELTVTIDIFDLSGRLVKKIEQMVYATGYRLEPISWDGTNNQGIRLEGGIYPYRITIEGEDANRVYKFSKLILQ